MIAECALPSAEWGERMKELALCGYRCPRDPPGRVRALESGSGAPGSPGAQPMEGLRFAGGLIWGVS